jgi:hypothetical protein
MHQKDQLIYLWNLLLKRAPSFKTACEKHLKSRVILYYGEEPINISFTGSSSSTTRLAFFAECPRHSAKDILHSTKVFAECYIW